MTTPDDPKRHYDVVAAVIRHEGRLLCMQKGPTRFPYTSLRWEFPGGKIEPGETPQQALQREIEEEMDMLVTVRDSVGKVRHEYPDFSITLEAFWCDVASPRFTLKEHHDFLWLSPDQLPSLSWAAADRKIVNLILSPQDEGRPAS